SNPTPIARPRIKLSPPSSASPTILKKSRLACLPIAIFIVCEKKRESRRTPSDKTALPLLEDQLQCELELTHAGGRTRRSIVFNVLNDSAGGTIDTGSAILVIVEAKHRVVEHVEGIHAELELHAFYQRKILQN